MDTTMATKFVALSSSCKECEWLKDLLNEISLWLKPIPRISIHCDSEATLAKTYYIEFIMISLDILI